MAPSQFSMRLRTTPASTGNSRPTAAHSCGSRTLDERANVRSANSWRRAALMRVLTSLASSNMARAARRFASSLSCLCFSLSSPLAATSVLGAGSPGFAPAASPALGVSSSRRLAESARRGVSLAIAPCNSRASASLSVRRACKPLSSRFPLLSDVSAAVSAARVWSRSSRWASCAPARPSPVRMRARTIQRNRRNADAGFITG